MAQRYAAQIIASRSEAGQQSEEFHSVDLNSMELVRPRRVGVEQLALHAAGQLKLQQKLQELGFNRHQTGRRCKRTFMVRSAPCLALKKR